MREEVEIGPKGEVKGDMTDDETKGELMEDEEEGDRGQVLWTGRDENMLRANLLLLFLLALNLILAWRLAPFLV